MLLHFTGVSLSTGINANNFYRAALNNRLSENDFSFKSNHTTELKLKVLDVIMNIDVKARMIGNYIPKKSQVLLLPVLGLFKIMTTIFQTAF